MPAYVHLAAWTERNAQHGDQIGHAMRERGIAADLVISNRVVQWAYEQTEAHEGLTWLRSDKLEPLAVEWRALF